MADRRRNIGIPSGVVFPFAGTTAPYGYLLCNGSAISRSEYPQLFLALGVSHGQGDGSTTFNLPDYRGRFMRGVDGGIGRDPDRTSRKHPTTGATIGDVVGSTQGHSFQTHTHVQDSHGHSIDGSASSSSTAPLNTTYPRPLGATVAAAAVDNVVNDSIATNQNAVATGTHAQATANETRPVNVNVNYIIKI